jgi:hypothetical protein
MLIPEADGSNDKSRSFSAISKRRAETLRYQLARSPDVSSTNRELARGVIPQECAICKSIVQCTQVITDDQILEKLL